MRFVIFNKIIILKLFFVSNNFVSEGYFLPVILIFSFPSVSALASRDFLLSFLGIAGPDVARWGVRNGMRHRWPSAGVQTWALPRKPPKRSLTRTSLGLSG